VLQDNLKFLANKCLPEETSDDEDESGSGSNALVQSFHNNLTPLGTHLGLMELMSHVSALFVNRLKTRD
jgi:hypothetical protein